MANLTIRNLSDTTRNALRQRAASNNRSMEAEVREILDAAALGETDFVGDWLEAARGLRGEFELPRRSPARDVGLA